MTPQKPGSHVSKGSQGVFGEGGFTIHLGDEVSEVERAEEGEVAGF